jgi:uncharacterized protein
MNAVHRIGAWCASLLRTAAVSSLVLVSLSAAAATDGKPVYLSLGTSAIGGTSHILGGGMAKIVRDEYPNIRISAEVTGGGIDDLKLVGAKKAQLGLSTADTIYDAYHGGGQFGFTKANPNLRGLVSGYPVKGQIYVLAKSGIKQIADLKGKRISVGAKGSLGNAVMPIIMEAHGLKMGQDWQPEYLGHGEGAAALADGNVDAVLAFGSTPSPAIMSVSTTHDIRLLSIEPEKVKQLVANRPFWKPTTIPANIYRKVDYPVSTFLVGIALFTDKDLPDDVAYAITRSILENTPKLAKVHAEGATFTAENVGLAIDGIMPYHPGAERYLKEKGRLK